METIPLAYNLQVQTHCIEEPGRQASPNPHNASRTRLVEEASSAPPGVWAEYQSDMSAREQQFSRC